ncbi:hypothetical protein BJ138DRAFT_1145397 [Hygrophoropsis aurantiaca]|uniref:Uncharacterized protein n=1 Tax=Hygrophoropsis aurantiaca TaxID=72124 RepID=A0ACB8ALC4_9AGAM|nr:hypothetical protein BJ138DRAFT_1145397 [Hygrophoropsis aurantiaca]
MMAVPVLLSRGLDPFLGVFTGCFAYYLYETNPRTALPPDQRLAPLLQWKWDKFRSARGAKLEALEKQEHAFFLSSRDSSSRE